VRHYLLVFAVTALVTFAATPLARRVSLRLGWIDRPSDRKVHPRPTPTAGGLAIYLGIVTGLLVSRFVPFLRDVFSSNSAPDAAVIGATMILIVGMIDDARGVSALGKLTGQVLVSAVLVLLGVQLLWFYFPWPGIGVLSLSPDLAVPLTIAWLVLMMNAVNLVDGLDGLAAGIVAIAASAFFAYMVRSPGGELEASSAALLSTVAVGAAVGFLPWNFHPAKIFMGDSGALLLGLVLGVATVSGVGRNVQGPSGGDIAVIGIPIVVPALLLAVPLVDVALAVVRRMRRGTGIGHADKEHIHHRLMEIGHSHRGSVLVMYLWSALVSGCALTVAFVDGRLVVSVVVASALGVGVILPRVARRWTVRGAMPSGNGERPPEPRRGRSAPARGAHRRTVVAHDGAARRPRR
jgi:UDP-GlcNAc:undecaprenyl-phosphate GlcNAc-1-phosphate transferase